jgi:hypothetical protein
MNIKTHKTLQPTRVGALSSAVAVRVFWSRVAQLCHSSALTLLEGWGRILNVVLGVNLRSVWGSKG